MLTSLNLKYLNISVYLDWLCSEAYIDQWLPLRSKVWFNLIFWWHIKQKANIMLIIVKSLKSYIMLIIKVKSYNLLWVLFFITIMLYRTYQSYYYQYWYCLNYYEYCCVPFKNSKCLILWKKYCIYYEFLCAFTSFKTVFKII